MDRNHESEGPLEFGKNSRGPSESKGELNSQEDLTINFKPLNKGLGFQPFEEGLPYSPADRSGFAPSDNHHSVKQILTPLETKDPIERHTPSNLGVDSLLSTLPRRTGQQLSSEELIKAMGAGSGAMQAGPPRFSKVLPVIAPHHPGAVVSQTKKRQTSGVNASEDPDLIERQLRNPLVDPLFQNESKELLDALEQTAQKDAYWTNSEDADYDFGYVLRRIAAFIFDLTVAGALFSSGIAILIQYKLVTLEFLLSSDVLFFIGTVFLMMDWLLMGVQEVGFGTTIGKWLFRLGFSQGPFRLFLRSILFAPSFLFFGIGVLVGLFGRRKACLHDRITGAQPSSLTSHPNQSMK